MTEVVRVKYVARHFFIHPLGAAQINIQNEKDNLRAKRAKNLAFVSEDATHCLSWTCLGEKFGGN
jgi:hypothetical protein